MKLLLGSNVAALNGRAVEPEGHLLELLQIDIVRLCVRFTMPNDATSAPINSVVFNNDATRTAANCSDIGI